MSSEKEIILEATAKANKRELSLDEAKDLVKKYPKSHRTISLLAFIYFQQSKFEKVIEEIKRALRYGKSLTAYNLSAQSNINLQNFEAANQDFSKALEIDANDIMTLINYAAFLGQTGKAKETIQITKKLTLMQPNNLELKVKLAKMYHQISDFLSAAEYLEGVVKEFPNEYIFHHLLGNSYFQTDREDDAAKCYEDAIKIKPDAERTYFNLATYYYGKENFSEVTPLLNKAMEFAPNWRAPYTQMCYSLYKQNEFAELKDFISKNIHRLKTSIEVAAISELVAVQEREKNSHPFCPDPMKYISEFDIGDYVDDKDIFLKDLKNEIDDLEFYDGFAPNSGKSQINGTQTVGNIFKHESNLLNQLKNFFMKAIDDYKKKYESSDSIIIKNFPDEIKLFGWSTKFDKGSGNHFSHIHPIGWISGAFYLNVPHDIKKHEANIQFDVQGPLPVFNNEINIEKRNIFPEPGKLVIFPSSLFHCTTPFSSENSYRHALNFDVQSPYTTNMDISKN